MSLYTFCPKFFFRSPNFIEGFTKKKEGSPENPLYCGGNEKNGLTAMNSDFQCRSCAPQNENVRNSWKFRSVAIIRLRKCMDLWTEYHLMLHQQLSSLQSCLHHSCFEFGQISVIIDYYNLDKGIMIQIMCAIPSRKWKCSIPPSVQNLFFVCPKFIEGFTKKNGPSEQNAPDRGGNEKCSIPPRKSIKTWF